MPNLHLISPPQPFILAAIGGSERSPLLSNDAFHLIAMRYAGIENIATSDPDFDGIKGIAVWKP
jgi:predicted nucleic acid-binding protein